MLKQYLFLFLISFSVPPESNAQEATFQHYQDAMRSNHKLVLSFSLQTALPQGSFAADVPSAGYGVNLQLGYRMKDLPIELVGSFDLILYGYQGATKAIGPSQPQSFEVVVDRFQYMLPLHLHLRYAPVWGKLSPYTEIFGGMRLIASRTRALGNALFSTPDNPETFSARADYYDFTHSFGIGAGVNYALADFGNVQYKVNLGARLLRGGKANYLSTDDIRLNGNQLIYTPRFNQTNLALLQIGFTALF